VPLTEWAKNELKDFIIGVFDSSQARNRPYFNHGSIMQNLTNEASFGRKLWGLLSLELWHQEFHDKQVYYKNLVVKGE
jgi:asparagine synthase (glutamine-hydrolysing)